MYNTLYTRHIVESIIAGVHKLTAYYIDILKYFITIKNKYIQIHYTPESDHIKSWY